MENNPANYHKILNILKHIDPYTTDILARVEKASLYTFCGIKNEWKDNGVEGEFFVCSRSVQPYSCIHILNHEKKQNLMEPILEDWDWKTQESLILYRKGEIILGIRFYSDEDYSKISILVGNIIDSLRFTIEKQKDVLTTPRIVKMLCEAQEDFKKVAGVIQEQLQKQSSSITNDHVNIEPTPNNSFISSPNEAQADSGQDQNSTVPLLPDSHQVNTSSVIDMEELENLASMLSVLEQNTGKPVLITPEMFEIMAKKEDEHTDHIGNVHVHKLPENKQNDDLDKPDPMSRKQMIHALIYLLRNDTDFVVKLHKAYIKAFMEML